MISPTWDRPVSREQTRTSWRHGALSFTLTLLIGAGILALTRDAWAQSAGMGQNVATSTEQAAPQSGSCGPDWNMVPTYSVGTHDNFFNGTAVVSSDDVWAVGSYNPTSVNTSQTLVEHWNGSAWVYVTSPDQGTHSNELNGVGAVAANDVWAVGNYNNGSHEQTLIEHWNGSAWTIVSSANATTNDNYLFSVAAVAANDIWAVGRYTTAAPAKPQTLVEHWNGSAWSIVASPNQGSLDNEFYGVGAVAANDVWAVGDYSNGSNDQTLIEHWNGSAWSIVSSPNPGQFGSLNAVSGGATDDVWAVGSGYVNGSSPTRTLIEHWNGSTWSIVPSPSPGLSGSILDGVAVVSAGNVWAVGGYYDGVGSPTLTLAEHWNGSGWRVVPTPNGTSTLSFFNAVAAVSDTDVWGIGVYDSPSGIGQPLAERYHPCASLTCGMQFQDVPSSNSFYTYIEAMACQTIVSGYPCGGPGQPCVPPGNNPYFLPNNNVTRGQIAKIVALSSSVQATPQPQIFEDVPPGSTFYPYVQILAEAGVMGGYTCGGPGEPCVPPANRPYFRPNSSATRGQLAKIDSNTVGFSDTPSGQIFQDVPPSDPFYTWIERLAERGIMSGYACGGLGEPCVPPGNLPYFLPNNNVTRGQTSKIVANTFFP